MNILPKKEDDLKKIFFHELENCNDDDLSNVSNELIIDKLNEINRMYGVANKLSSENQRLYRIILFILAALGTFLVVFFLAYDTANWHGVIALCLLMIVFLGFSRRIADNSLCHKKYLEFRLLAESLRLQFFLSVAGIKKPVADILPWFVKSGSPWIRETMDGLKLPELDDSEKRHILNFWIRNQISYHEYTIKKTIRQKERSEQINKIVRWLTVFAYVFAGCFELYVYFHSPIGFDAEHFRDLLKIVLGVMSALTLFVDSFYGKKSLGDVINDSKRMRELYIETEKRVMHEGEPEEVLVELAREYLIENSIWYAYQNQNKPDLVM